MLVIPRSPSQYSEYLPSATIIKERQQTHQDLFSPRKQQKTAMALDEYDCGSPVADFFYHIVGDKTSYSQELENLFVCYTLTRGLRVESASPRRPSLPTEIILCIIRYAGFVSVNPDPALTLSTSPIPCEPPHLFCEAYATPELTRVHLMSMARIRLYYDHTLTEEFLVSLRTMLGGAAHAPILTPVCILGGM